MKRYLPIAALVLLLALALSQGWQRAIAWETLAGNHAALAAFVARYPALAAAGFVAVYAAAVALAIPGAGVLSLAGGVLFGTVAGSALVSLACTLGAVVLFLAARTAFAGLLARHWAGLVARIGPRLRRDGFSFLLAIRLVSVVPFGVGSLAAAMVGMRLLPFTGATLLGVLPSTVLLTWIGAGLGGELRAGRAPGVGLLLRPDVLLPLLGLALLALAPVAWRAWKGDIKNRSATDGATQ